MPSITLARAREKPFITVDCGSIPGNLVENELFGHVRGAFTDAGTSSKGLLQEAEGGTLFLDEVESLPLGAQTKFLRFLQSREFKPLGQTHCTSLDVRVVAATNTNLLEVVARKMFREDLFLLTERYPALHSSAPSAKIRHPVAHSDFDEEILRRDRRGRTAPRGNVPKLDES